MYLVNHSYFKKDMRTINNKISKLFVCHLKNVISSTRFDTRNWAAQDTVRGSPQRVIVFARFQSKKKFLVCNVRTIINGSCPYQNFWEAVCCLEAIKSQFQNT